MYVLRCGWSRNYVNLNMRGSIENPYSQPLKNAQRFDSITDILTAVQREQERFTRENKFLPLPGRSGGPILSDRLSIERVVTKTIPARVEETTEAL